MRLLKRAATIAALATVVGGVPAVRAALDPVSAVTGLTAPAGRETEPVVLKGDAFAGWVAWLTGELDRLGDEAGAGQRVRMAELFATTVRYEIAFWELAYGRADGWPGIREVA